MVVLTGGVVAVIGSAGSATPIVAAAAQAGLASGVTATAVSTAGTAATLAGAAGGGAAAGAIAGAGTAAVAGTSVAAGATVGATVGGAAATAVTSASTGAAAITAGFAAGPVGWILLGASEKNSTYSWDCWKPIVHDTSPEPSDGMLLKDISVHPCVRDVTVREYSAGSPPHIVIENIWGEFFNIEFVELNGDIKIAAHATKL